MSAASSPLAVLLMGPTASGKSRVALELAQRLPLEIVSVDSAQVYRGMDIGTAKPSVAERASVPHHLIDILPPTEAYSAARFRADALRVIGEIRSRARLPLLVGGTMLYFKALLEGLSRLPSADAGIRAQIEAEARALGWPALHARLAAVDPDTAARLKPRDSQRIQRALEVYRITGEPMSRLLFHPPPLAGEKEGAFPSPPPLAAGREGALPNPPPLAAGREGAFLSIALLPGDRARLHERISARLAEMLSRGLVEEVETLRQKYALSADLPSMRSVGYRQVWQHLEGEFDRAELKDRAIYATRQLAKRQMTWLRSWPGCSVFDCFDPALSGKLYELIN